MAPTVPDYVPLVITAGTTVKFTRAFQNYPPADGWKYSFHLNGPTDAVHKDAETGSDPFSIVLTPTDLDIDADLYHYEEQVVSADESETYSVGNGPITVELNLATAPPGATQSFAQKMVKMIEDAIAGRIPDDLQSYQIAGRAIVKIPIKELQDMLGKFRAQVARQANPSALGGPPAKVAFTEEETAQTYPPTWVDVTGINR